MEKNSSIYVARHEDFLGSAIFNLLKEEGYTTGAVVSGGAIGSAYNFNKGFDYFSDNSKYDKIMRFFRKIGTERYNLRKVIKQIKLFDVFWRSHDKTNKEVLNWLEKNNNKKFFLFVHYFDLHGDTFGKLNKKNKEEFKLENYNENVKLIDNSIGDVINKLPQNIDRVGVVTSGPVEEISLPGYTKEIEQRFGSLKFVWYQKR